MNDDISVYQNFSLKSLVLWMVVFFLAIGCISYFFPTFVDQLDTLLPWGELLFYILLSGWLIYYSRQAKVGIKSLINPQNFRWKQLLDIHLVVPVLIVSAASGIMIEYWFPGHMDSAPLDPSVDTWLFILGNFLVLVIFAPLVEELIYRKILLNSWASKWGVARAMVFTSLLFGIQHFDIFGAVIFGVTMAVLAIRNHNQISNIIVHALNNLIVFCLLLLGPSSEEATALTQQDFITFSVILIIALVWIAIILAFKKSQLDLPEPSNLSLTK